MLTEADGLTPRQQAWFASVREGLLRETGRPLEAWVEIARACPHTRPRARLAWFKAVHGLGQNRASVILHAAFEAAAGFQGEALWTDPARAAVLASVAEAASDLRELVVGRRKSFTAFSRTFQFAALRPLRGGGRLGLALDPATHPRLSPRGSESWSERLTARLDLPDAAAVDAVVRDLLKAAWERS